MVSHQVNTGRKTRCNSMKKAIWRKPGYLLFTYRLMLLYLLLVMLTDAIIGYYSYTTLAESKKEYTKAEFTRSLQQARDNILIQVKDIYRISDQLFNDYKMQNLLQSTEEGYNIYEATANYLIPVMEMDTELALNPILLAIYTNNNNIREIYYPGEDPLANGKTFAIYNISRISGQEWYRKLRSEGMDNIWLQTGNDAKYSSISLVRKLVSFSDFNEIGYLRITIRIKDLFQAVDSFKASEETFVFLVNDLRGKVVFSNIPERINTRWSDNPGRNYLIVKEKLPGTEWSIIGLIPDEKLMVSARGVLNLTIVVCVGSFILISILGYFISRHYSFRVKRIVSMAKELQEGNLSSRIMYEDKDEFSLIASAFNKMAENIEELIEKVYISDINKKEAELEALQSQINPHFLYNTLSSINSLANLGEIATLSAMVSGLARFYRLTLNDGNIFITVEKELEQVQTYIDIQNIKYSNRIDISYNVDSEVLRFLTIKLILQPFVENVLKHAWFGDRIHIRLECGIEDGRLIFQIIDNGLGMSKMILERIMSVNEFSGGYGIRNVDERIKLHYGDKYGVHIFSRRGIGTVVKIAIPVPLMSNKNRHDHQPF